MRISKYLFPILCFALWGCDYPKFVTPIAASHAIDSAITIEKKMGIRIREYTDFEWDKLYVFGPYTRAENVAETLGFDWADYDKYGLESSDTFDLLVFIMNFKVVRADLYSRASGDFQKEIFGKEYSPRTAVFKIKWKDGRYIITP